MEKKNCEKYWEEKTKNNNQSQINVTEKTVTVIKVKKILKKVTVIKGKMFTVTRSTFVSISLVALLHCFRVRGSEGPKEQLNISHIGAKSVHVTR